MKQLLKLEIKMKNSIKIKNLKVVKNSKNVLSITTKDKSQEHCQVFRLHNESDEDFSTRAVFICNALQPNSVETTFDQVIETLKVWRENVVYDLSSEWIKDEDKRKMSLQLSLLNQGLSSLETIGLDINGQIFSSSILKS